MSEQVETVEVKPLRRVLQHFNEDLGKYINDDQRFKLGRVLTIIDASIQDAEQRKAIKDLVQNEWWSPGNRPSESAMTSPHTDIRGLSIALGFELYPPTEDGKVPLVGNMDFTEFATERYRKITVTEE